MKEFCALRAKTYAYLMDDDSEKKKSKGTKTYVMKRRLMFENYKDCLFNNKIILKLQHGFKSDHHDVYTVEINETALSSNDDKRLQTLKLQRIHTEQMILKYAKVKLLIIDYYDHECLLSARINTLKKHTAWGL